METMFPGKVNSPATTLDGAIDNTVTTIDVIDGSVLPTAPNIAVIGTGEDAETILYGTKATNQLTSVTRGYQGTAKAWDSGATIARMFTEKDYANLKANIEAHETAITEIEKVIPRKIKTDATAAPAVTNDITEGYAVNSIWIDVTNDKAYICVDATDGAAVWIEITSQGVGDALTTDPLSQFAATTSAELAGVISDETGTDKLVYNTSPTLVTPTLGAAAATSINFGDTSLNHYEEGTWTPALKFGGDSVDMTYSTQEGLYTKIGRQVTVSCEMVLTSKGSSTGIAIIRGLPFGSTATTRYIAALFLKGVTYVGMWEGSMVASGTFVYLGEVTEAGTYADLDNTDFTDTAQIRMTLTYFTD